MTALSKTYLTNNFLLILSNLCNFLPIGHGAFTITYLPSKFSNALNRIVSLKHFYHLFFVKSIV